MERLTKQARFYVVESEVTFNEDVVAKEDHSWTMRSAFYSKRESYMRLHTSCDVVGSSGELLEPFGCGRIELRLLQLDSKGKDMILNVRWERLRIWTVNHFARHDYSSMQPRAGCILPCIGRDTVRILNDKGGRCCL